MYSILFHTADVRLRVEADTLEALFAEAMRGLFAVMRGTVAGQPVTRTLHVEDSANVTSLLVDFLNDVLVMTEATGVMFEDATIAIDGTSLRAELRGFMPSEFEEDVKAVTYHEADVRYENGIWSTMLVLDI